MRELIARMARENPAWGSEQICGELLKLGIAVSKRSVQQYRRRGPAGPPRQSWRTFLANHRPDVWAADLFTVQTVACKTLYVLLFITHGRRELVHGNVTARPTFAWVWRQLIEATPWGRTPRYLLRDRDAVYGGDFVPRAQRLGIRTVLSPVRAPRANAVAERVVRTLGDECLDRVITLNERNLRSILAEFVRFYNEQRPHRTLALETPLRAASLPSARSTPGRWLAGCTRCTSAPLDAAELLRPYSDTASRRRPDPLSIRATIPCVAAPQARAPAVSVAELSAAGSCGSSGTCSEERRGACPPEA